MNLDRVRAILKMHDEGGLNEGGAEAMLTRVAVEAVVEAAENETWLLSSYCGVPHEPKTVRLEIEITDSRIRFRRLP